MSFDNITPATSIMPQLAANPATGQIFMIAPNPQHPTGISYFIPQHQIIQSQPQQLQRQQIQQRIRQQEEQLAVRRQFLQHQQQLQQQHIQLQQKQQLQIQQQQQLHQLEQQTEPATTTSPPTQTIEQTNSKISGLREKCIAHYIDGQLIIETTKPLSDKKIKSTKKRKLNHHTNPEQRQDAEQGQNVEQRQDVEQLQHVEQQQPLPPPESKQTIRSKMPNWSVQEVVDFIERHEDIRQYSSKFAEDEIDGKALLLMIDRNLNFQVLTSMFKYGPALKIEATLSKYKANTD